MQGPYIQIYIVSNKFIAIWLENLIELMQHN